MRYSAAVLFLVLVSGTPGLTYQVIDLEVRPTSEGTVVRIDANEPIQEKVYSLSRPERIVVDCGGGVHLAPPRAYDVNRGGIARIVTSQLEVNGGAARAVIELSQPSSYSVRREGSHLDILLAGTDVQFTSWALSRDFATSHAGSPVPAQVVDVSGQPGARSPAAAGSSRNLPSKPVSLDLEEADVLTVLRALSDYAGHNIVVSSEVKGTVTVRLHNVAWSHALDEICKVTGLSYIVENNIIRVAPPAKLKSEEEERLKGDKAIELLQPLVTRVYKLEFATAGEMRAPLGKMLSEKGTLEVEPRTNSLVVTDIASKQKQMADLVRILDSSTPQVEITCRIVEANLDAARNLGISWSADNLQLKGIAGSDIRVEAPTTELPVVSFNVGTITSWASLEASIDAIEREAKGKALANPRIMATNNKEAEIFAGKKIPISTRDQAGNVIAQYIEAGISMKIVPHINSLEDITLDLTGEVSEPDLANLVQGLPLITTNKAQTRVLLRDGATVVLGGLKKTNQMESERGVPVLRSIPLLGALFKSRAVTAEDREILIFVTPHLVKAPGNSGG
jgi:type IV pilus assembly protein PilQ